MSAASVVLSGQAAAEAEMLDSFTAYAPSGKSANASGQKVQGYVTQGTTVGKMQVKSRGDGSARSINIGGIDRPVVEEGLHLPVSAAGPTLGNLGTGWEYVLDTVGPTTPPELEGSRWLVVDALTKSYMTARRLHVVRLS